MFVAVIIIIDLLKWALTVFLAYRVYTHTCMKSKQGWSEDAFAVPCDHMRQSRKPSQSLSRKLESLFSLLSIRHVGRSINDDRHEEARNRVKQRWYN